ncbi:MAG: DUF1697 domain-containing protein [Solirubrobacterales bacterium]
MAPYAAFLRGVNLGPTRKVRSGELRSVFEALGFRDVDAFQTSGNVVFEADREAAAKLSARIERALESSLGFDVAIFLRTAAEVRAIAEEQPFPRGPVEASKGKLQVMMLAAKPGTRSRKQVLAHATDEDGLAFGNRELYWLPSGGIRDSRLNLKAIEKLLGATTMRTMGTVERMAAKYFAG